jgi:hypothetical protein
MRCVRCCGFRTIATSPAPRWTTSRGFNLAEVERKIADLKALHSVRLCPGTGLKVGWDRAYQMRMPLRLLRQIFSVLLVVAYVSAMVIAIAPAAKAAPGAMASGMTMQADQMGGGMDDMPCKSKTMKSNCVTDAGCIFMLSLPAPHVNVGTPLAWVFVTFSIAAESVPGHSITPLLGPPISRA